MLKVNIAHDATCCGCCATSAPSTDASVGRRRRSRRHGPAGIAGRPAQRHRPSLPAWPSRGAGVPRRPRGVADRRQAGRQRPRAGDEASCSSGTGCRRTSSTPASPATRSTSGSSARRSCSSATAGSSTPRPVPSRHADAARDAHLSRARPHLRALHVPPDRPPTRRAGPPDPGPSSAAGRPERELGAPRPRYRDRAAPRRRCENVARPDVRGATAVTSGACGCRRRRGSSRRSGSCSSRTRRPSRPAPPGSRGAAGTARPSAGWP